jgi:alkylhydroperoxidase/carboxymuconolactone decarboxylase family protein YurZ
MNPKTLPPIVESLSREHPAVWEAYNRLGQAAAAAGPLDARTERLVKLAIAVGAGREGAVHSHVHRGLDAGLTPIPFK